MRAAEFDRLQKACAAIGCSLLWPFAGMLALGIVINNTAVMVIGGIPLALACCFGLGFTGPFFMFVPLVFMVWAVVFWIGAIKYGWAEALEKCF